MKGTFTASGSTLDEKNRRESARRQANTELLQKLRAGRGGALVERVEIDGDEYFLKRLSWPEVTRVKLALPRDASKVLDLRNADLFEALTVALVVSCVVLKPEGWGEDGFEVESLKREDLTLQFDADEAVAYTNEPGAMQLIMQLFHHATRLNPNVLPTSGGSSKTQ